MTSFRSTRVLAFALTPLLAACAQAAPRVPPAADGVDYACTNDADCAVKDVGNCCGYFPACVNRTSPTFPERVRAQCAKDRVAGTCGFPVIQGCRCAAHRCVVVTDGSESR